MKEVTKFQANNGKICDSAEEALKIDLLVDLTEELSNSEIYWRETGPEEVAEFLLETFELVRKPGGKGEGK